MTFGPEFFNGEKEVVYIGGQWKAVDSFVQPINPEWRPPAPEVVPADDTLLRARARDKPPAGVESRFPWHKKRSPEVLDEEEFRKRLRWLRQNDRAKAVLAEEKSTETVIRLRERASAWIPSDEFLATVEPLAYRVEPLLIKGGRTLLSGSAKAGKSTLALSLCNSLLTGKPFLGRFPVTPIEGSVVYANLEMPEPLFGEWIEWHIDEKVRPRFRLWNAIAEAELLDTRYEAGLDFLTERVTETEAEALIIDPITMAYAALGINGNSNDEVAPWLNGLNVLKARTGDKLEITLLHHFGHDMDRGRGASVQHGWPEHLWDFLVKDERRYLRSRGRAGFMEPTEVKFDPLYGGVWMDEEPVTLSGTRAAAKADDLLDEIEVLLRSSLDGMFQKELTDAIEARASDVRAVLNRAVEDGQITMTKDGRMNLYRWVE